MAKVTKANPLKPGEIRISPGKPRETSREKAVRASGALGGMSGRAAEILRSATTPDHRVKVGK